MSEGYFRTQLSMNITVNDKQLEISTKLPLGFDVLLTLASIGMMRFFLDIFGLQPSLWAYLFLVPLISLYFRVAFVTYCFVLLEHVHAHVMREGLVE